MGRHTTLLQSFGEYFDHDIRHWEIFFAAMKSVEAGEVLNGDPNETLSVKHKLLVIE